MTQGEHAIWGELRGALSAPPEDRWVRVCDVLDDAMRALPVQLIEEQLLPYCLRALRATPHHRFRTTPEHWIGALMRGEEVPALALCTELFAKEKGLDDETAPKLLSSPHLVGIERLDLRWNDIGPRGAQALADNPALAGVTKLNMWGNGIGDAGASALAASETLTSLEHMFLQHNAIGDDGAVAIASSPLAERLLECSLGGGRVGDRGALALGANAFPRLRSLYLGQNDIGDGGAYALARAEMPKMRNLYLSGNGISDEGATELAASSLMGHLRQLDLRRNPIGAAGQAALKERAAQHKALTLHVDDPPYVAADPQAAEPPSMSGRLLSRLVNLLDQ